MRLATKLGSKVLRGVLAGALCVMMIPLGAFAQPIDRQASTADAAAIQAATQGESALAKTEVSLNGEWSFTDPDVEGVQTVTVPHSWECMKSAYNLYANVKTCTYEKKVDVADYAGKQLLLRFDGVNKIAKVYVDDELMGTHTGGFTAFTIDITNGCADKKTVTVKVEVQNISFDTMPVNSDFTHWAGIYRDVNLVIVDKAASISVQDEGSKGIYMDSSVDLSSGTATLEPRVMVDYDFSAIAEGSNISVETNLLDAEGNQVGTAKKQLDATSGSAVASEVDLSAIKVANAHLWNGTDDPYLYTAEVNLYVGDALVDTESTRVGFREYNVDGDTFYLNGKEYELRGVGMHQEFGAQTNAVSDEQHKADIMDVLEMGANALRTSHYPHSQYIYDLCDQYGIVVWCEIPFYLVMLETDTFKENCLQSAREMVKQGYNHPSIIIWGIENEVNVYPQYQTYYPTQASPEQLAKFMVQLASTVKELDPSRMVGEALLSKQSFMEEAATWTTDSSDIDVAGFNIYGGWYGATYTGTREAQLKDVPSNFTRSIDNYESILSASSSKVSYVLTEYGAGANVNQHAVIDENFSYGENGTYQSTGNFHPEEFQAFLHEADIMYLYGDETNNITGTDKIWAAFVWAMYDFSCYRNEGGTTRLNTKGLVTADRQTKKDAFYLYKANWNDEDLFTYITSRRFTDRNALETQVKVYSNCDSVELTVNGQSLGAGAKLQDGVFVWENVHLDKTSNTVVAQGFEGGVAVCSDQVDDWAWSGTFADVTDSKVWYYDNIYAAADLGLIAGYNNGYYGVGDTLTRAQAAVILWRYFAADEAAGYDSASATNQTGMSDVSDAAFYTGAANWAVENGVINGKKNADGTRYFDPEGTITREQLCAIVANAAEKFCGATVQGADTSLLNGMPDASSVSSWATDAVAWGLNTGLVKGANRNNVRYVDALVNVNRATMASVLMNAINNGIISKE